MRDHLFETSISADKILGLDDRVVNEISIPISAWEETQLLYEEIQQKLPDYLPQFYNAAAAIINTNYVEPQVFAQEYDEVPF